MTEEPMTGPEPAVPERRVDAEPSTDLVVPTPHPVVRPVRGRAGLAVRVRRQLELLRQKPATRILEDRERRLSNPGERDTW